MMTYDYQTPIGWLRASSQDQALVSLDFISEPEVSQDQVSSPLFDQVQAWLTAYFQGHPPAQPDFALNLQGSDFQKRVWQHLLEIPYGQVQTYGHLADLLAQDLGRTSMSAQAVGGAVGRNPINLILPCHRVVGSQGHLTGYRGGMAAKIHLLTHEGWTIQDQSLCLERSSHHV